jgi:hypothetical protein
MRRATRNDQPEPATGCGRPRLQSRCGWAWLLPVLLLPLAAGAGEEDADIVLFCHLTIGEFGYDAIDICVKENRAARAEVQRPAVAPPEVVARCTRQWEPDWVTTLRCVNADTAAAKALSTYPAEHDATIRQCRDQVGEDGNAAVHACVERALAAARTDGGVAPVR